MTRRVAVAVLVAATLVLAGVGAYSKFLRPPDVAPDTVPVFHATPGDPPQAPDTFAELAKTDPVGMLASCLTRYQQDAKGFTALLAKRERILGKLHDPELVRVAVWGDVPDADGTTHVRVRMVWDQGARKDPLGNAIRGSLYVEGEHKGQMLIHRPNAYLMKEMHVDPKVALARDSSRYCITDAGIYRGMLRTYTAWKKRKDEGGLKAEYLGRRAVEEVGGRECHVVKRTCKSPEVDSFALDEQPATDPKVVERDGFTEVTLYVDAERQLQLGTVLRRADGELVGEYYFRDVRLVPGDFPPDTFTPAALKQ
jgi:hypothetical protein